MRSIAVINQKGGSGKTTTSVNLAAALAEKKRKVLLIDLDPQGSATSWFGLRAHEQQNMYSLFTEGTPLKQIIMPTEISQIDIVPSSQWLISVEKALARELGAENILKTHIKTVQADYEYLLIDCPPNLGLLTINALCAVDELIIPVEAKVMALNGLVQLLQTVEVIQERMNKSLKIAGIVPCRLDLRTRHAKEIISTLESNFEGMLFKTAIRENIRVAEAPSFAQPITQYDTTSNGAADYRDLADELVMQERVG